MSEWISAREAAEVTGVAEDTIEWWSRQGRIRRRPRHGNRPTLELASVEGFAASYVPKGRRSNRPSSPRPSRDEWLIGHRDLAAVQAAIGVSESTVRRWVEAGRMAPEKHPTRGWLRFTPDEVDRVCRERQALRDDWISYAEAAKLLDVSTGTVRGLIVRGELEHRPGPRWRPSIPRGSVEERQARRNAEQEAARATAAAKGPPDDGEVWLGVTEAALVLRISRNRVGQLIHAGRVPATRKGRRWWIRRTHVENLSAARAMKETRSAIR